jgi:hypothetical protein
VAGSVPAAAASWSSRAERPGPRPRYKARLVFQAVEQEMEWNSPDYYDLYGRYLLAGIPPTSRALLRRVPQGASDSLELPGRRPGSLRCARAP